MKYPCVCAQPVGVYSNSAFVCAEATPPGRGERWSGYLLGVSLGRRQATRAIEREKIKRERETGRERERDRERERERERQSESESERERERER